MDYAATILSKLPGASKRDHGLRRLLDTVGTYLPDEQVEAISRAYEFGAMAHEGQTRKTGEPYITHPVAVAQSLAEMHLDSEAIMAAILHDTIEDTETSADELEEVFGPEVRDLVEEVTDDKSLLKHERKQHQVDHSRHLSDRAKMIKLADKICNTRDVGHAPPADWSFERRLEYLSWSEAVVEGCRGVNERLERYFDEVLERARDIMS